MGEVKRIVAETYRGKKPLGKARMVAGQVLDHEARERGNEA